MSAPPSGKQALISEIGAQRYYASWTSNEHRKLRLLAEFIGMFGLTFILSGGAAMIVKYGGGHPSPYAVALILSAFSALWLMVAILFLGDISAHFNPAMTFAFALRGDMGWPMAVAYWVVQCVEIGRAHV